MNIHGVMTDYLHKIRLLLLLLLLSNCLKGYTKGMCLYKVIPLHTIFTVTKIQLQKQNNIYNTSTELNNQVEGLSRLQGKLL